MNRRQFLATNVAALAGAGFFANWGTAAEIREYKDKNKPLLTENNLNRLFATTAEKRELEALAKRAMSDLPKFLDEQFSLSPNQRKMIGAFNREDVAALHRLLEASVKAQIAPEFRFGGGEGAECAKTAVMLQTKAGAQKIAI